MSWAEDAAALILDPKRTWAADRPLAELIRRVMLDEGAVVTGELRDKVVIAALAYGQTRATVSNVRSERAEREGARGYLWLPEDVEGDLERDGVPWNADDVVVVADGLDFDRRQVMQRQRWAALRMGRALGREYKRSTLRKYGHSNRSVYAQRLVADLAAFFADDEAVEQFVINVVPLELQQARFRQGSFVSEPLRRRLRVAAEKLRAVARYYPSHLTTLDLAKDRELAPYSPNEAVESEHSYYVAQLGYVDDFGYVGERNRESAWTVLERERRLVVLGDPGSGKSTIARAAVLRALAASERAVAGFVSAPVLIRELVTREQDWLEALARSALTTALSPPSTIEVEELAGLLRGSASPLIVLDGIDEIFEPHARQLLDEVIDGLADLRVRVLLTSRMVGYHPRAGWTTMRTLPLSDDFEAMLQRWYGDIDPDAIVRGRASFESNEDVKDLVTSPVLAGLLAARAADPDADELVNPSHLYGWAVSILCEREWKNPQHPRRSEHEVMTLLATYEAAAWALSGGNESNGPVAWDSVTSYRDLHESGIDVETIRSGELLIEYGATGPASRIDAPWLWLHRSFADYLVAVRLGRMWRAGDARIERVLQRALQSPDAWLGALRIFAGQLNDDDLGRIEALVDALTSEGDPGDVIQDTADNAFFPDNLEDDFFEDDDATEDDEDDPGREVDLAEALSRPEDIPYLLEYIRTDADRLEAVRAYVALTPEASFGYEFRDIRDDAPAAYATVLAERLTQLPPGGELILSAWGGGLPSGHPSLEPLWAGHREHTFPECLPYGLALSYYLLEQDELDDDTRLVLWARSMLPGGVYRPLPKRARASKKLLVRTLRGDRGEWAAFAVAQLAPRLTARHIADVATHARIGLLFTAFSGSGLQRKDAPVHALPLTLSSAEAIDVVGRFSASDLSDIDAVEKLL